MEKTIPYKEGSEMTLSMEAMVTMPFLDNLVTIKFMEEKVLTQYGEMTMN